MTTDNAETKEQTKSRKGLIIGVVATIVLVAAAVLIYIFVFSNKGKISGTYVCEDYKSFGVTLKIKLSKNRYKVRTDSNGEVETEEGKYRLEGDKLYFDGEEAGVYDADKKMISIGFDGVYTNYIKK